MNGDTIPYIITMVALVLMSGYFSATETAFSCLNRTRIKTMAEKGNRKAALVHTLSEQYDRLLSTILIGNNIVNIVLASMGTVLFVHLYGDIGATISTIVITVAVLIFGEITPKSMAKDNSERFAMMSAPVIRGLIFILTPVNFLFTLWKKLLSKIMKVSDNPKMTQDELLMLVEEVQKDGSIDEDEGDLLRNAIEFTDRDAEDILTHRVDLEAVPITATKETVAEVFSESKYSRLLVYEDSIDNIVGVIHQKDFYVGTGISDRELRDIITPPLFVPKSDKISDLLRLLQKSKSHIAVIIDEYGGTLGIVTMEDILEELVGEIWDEHDEVVENFKKINDTTYRVDCSLDLDNLLEFFEIDETPESTSISGWVMEQLGKIPSVGDNFTYRDLRITVITTDMHRVLEIEIRRLPAAQAVAAAAPLTEKSR